MPTYQYACRACGHAFEAVQSFSDDALTQCPQCAGALRKVFSSVGVVFKGSGFYKTDSRAGSASSTASAGASTAAAGSGSDSGSTPKGDSSSSTAGGTPATPSPSPSSGAAPSAPVATAGA